MTEPTENLVLEHLRAIRGDLRVINERLDGVDYRLNAIEHAIAGMAKNIANVCKPKRSRRCYRQTGVAH